MKTITQHYIDGAFVESYGRRVPVAHLNRFHASTRADAQGTIFIQLDLLFR
jgi:hypothetical protein